MANIDGHGGRRGCVVSELEGVVAEGTERLGPERGRLLLLSSGYLQCLGIGTLA
jgi:hypothetical protein